MTGVIYATDLGEGEIGVDFAEALDSSKRQGVVVLIVPQNAIEPVHNERIRCDARRVIIIGLPNESVRIERGLVPSCSR